MQPNSIHMIGATGKTGGRVDSALGYAENNARFQDSSDGQTVV